MMGVEFGNGSLINPIQMLHKVKERIAACHHQDNLSVLEVWWDNFFFVKMVGRHNPRS